MPPQTADTQLRPYRILICEDSADSLEMLEALLRAEGYEVLKTADGEEAIGELKNSVIDQLVLDLSLPRLDGFSVLDYVYETRPGLPVIVITGLPAEEIEARLKKMKRHDLPPLLLKPFDTQQLIDLIEVLREQPSLSFDPNQPDTPPGTHPSS